MEIQYIVALGLAIPVVVFPAAFVWYILNISGLWLVIRESRARQKMRAKGHKEGLA